MNDLIQIEEILTEASAYFLRHEVSVLAQQKINQGTEALSAHILSFNKLINQNL